MHQFEISLKPKLGFLWRTIASALASSLPVFIVIAVVIVASAFLDSESVNRTVTVIGVLIVLAWVALIVHSAVRDYNAWHRQKTVLLVRIEPDSISFDWNMSDLKSNIYRASDHPDKFHNDGVDALRRTYMYREIKCVDFRSTADTSEQKFVIHLVEGQEWENTEEVFRWPYRDYHVEFDNGLFDALGACPVTFIRT